MFFYWDCLWSGGFYSNTGISGARLGSARSRTSLRTQGPDCRKPANSARVVLLRVHLPSESRPPEEILIRGKSQRATIFSFVKIPRFLSFLRGESFTLSAVDFGISMKQLVTPNSYRSVDSIGVVTIIASRLSWPCNLTNKQRLI